MFAYLLQVSKSVCMSRQSFFQKIDQIEENSGSKIIENVKGWEKPHNSNILQLKPETYELTLYTYTLESRNNPKSNGEKANHFPVKESIPMSYHLPLLHHTDNSRGRKHCIL